MIEHTSTQNKTARILDAFDALLVAGRLNVHSRVAHGRFATEMRAWQPDASVADDGLDAVAGCLLAEPVRFAGAPRPTDARARAMTNWRRGADPVKLTLDFEV